DGQFVLQPRRRKILDRATPHREADAALHAEPAVRKSQAAQHLAAPTLGEAEVVGVIDHAGGVSILVIDAQRQRVRCAAQGQFSSDSRPASEAVSFTRSNNRWSASRLRVSWKRSACPGNVMGISRSR